MPATATERVEALWRLGRESLLLPAAIYVENFDDLLQEGRNAELVSVAPGPVLKHDSPLMID